MGGGNLPWGWASFFQAVEQLLNNLPVVCLEFKSARKEEARPITELLRLCFLFGDRKGEGVFCIFSLR